MNYYFEIIVSLVIILIGIYIFKKNNKSVIMGNESIELFLSIFTNYFFIFLFKANILLNLRVVILLDEDFSKPQAFINQQFLEANSIIISLNLFFIIYYLLYSKFLLDYFLISNLMFL